jgi:hypothetical protein
METEGNNVKPSDQEITDYMRKYNRCPDCGCDGFLEGPSGGLSQNVECAGCGARFNMMGPFGVERIGEPTRVPEGCLLARFEEPVLETVLFSALKMLGFRKSARDCGTSGGTCRRSLE